MLTGRDTKTIRLQCGSCRAHALMQAEDYEELVADSDGHMRCGVCGAHVRFVPTERQQPALAHR